MRKKVLGLMGVGVYLVCATQVLALDLEWKTKTPMPTERAGLAAVTLNGKIYAIGGRDPWGKVVEEFDPSVGPNGTWTRKADMLIGGSLLAAAVLNGKIYVFGGGYKNHGVEEYNPITDTWTQKADMPRGRYGLAAVALNGKIYAIGGNGSEPPYTGERAEVEEFDPSVGPDGTWTTKIPMLYQRRNLSAVTLNDKIYAIGGYHYGIVNIVEEFDPTVGTNGTWTRKADMPTERGEGIRVVAINGKIYAIGGHKSYDTFNVVEEFDPTADTNGTWMTKTSMPTARWSFGATVLNGKIYAIGGSGGENVVEEATLGAPVETNIINGSDTGTLTVADAKGDAILIYAGMGGTKTVTCMATTTTILQGYGIGYLASPIDQSVFPTATVYYNYEVSNSSNGTDTITISATTLSGATWSVTLIDDDNQDGFRQDDENTILSSPVTLKQNESRKFFLKVDVSIAGSATIRVKVNSSQSDSWGDIDERQDLTLTFARGYGVQLTSPADLSGSPSTTIYYPYCLTNSGNATDTITLSASNVAGGTWTITTIRDDNQDGLHQATETTQIGSITLAAGQSNYFFLKVDIPLVEIGATSTNKVIASCSGTDTVPWGDLDTIEDITITTCSAPVPYLTLEKYVLPTDAQLPGATLTYTLKYRNVGNAEAINVQIQDVIPAWASYVANSGTGTVGTGGGNSISVNYNDATKVITFTVNGSVQPSGSGECRFEVVIK
ncbi:MAG: hypothetical protein AB1414_14790 [bacterium]